jgi:putative membrane protein
MQTIVRFLLYTVAVLITAWVLPGVAVENFWIAFVVAVILSLLNTFLKPLLIVLTIPVTILTLGLFLLVINAGIIMLAGAIVPGFSVENFWWALLFSIILSLITSILGVRNPPRRVNDQP